MEKIGKLIRRVFILSLLSEYPFFIVTAMLLWQNTLFAFKEWTFEGVIQYTFLALLYSYLMTIFIYLCHSKLIKGMMYSIAVTIFFFNVYLRFRFSSNISPNVLQLIMETNLQETSEFINNYLWHQSSLLSFLFLLVVFVLIILVEKIFLPMNNIPRWGFLFPVVILVGGFISFYRYTSIFKCKNVIEVEHWVAIHGAKAMDNFSNIVCCIYDIHLCSKEISKAVESTCQAYLEHVNCQAKDSLNVVLVVGESYNKWHAGLYGYKNSTTPYMDKELQDGNLFLFEDVVSPYNFTSKTLRNVFSTNCCTIGESWSEYPFFPTIFCRAGYDVVFWDNQYDPMSREEFDFSLNSYLHNIDISTMTYSATNQKKYDLDGDLVDDFISESKNNENPLQLSILHLMGQHFAYYNRFPHGGFFDYFNADSILRNDDYLNQEKLQLIADYDNATRYNDYVIYTILQHYRQKNCVVVYFSDHGEEIYDYQNFKGRNWKEPLSSDLLRHQFAVPFWVWCSDTYMKKNSIIISQLKRAIKRPLMLDNICHLLFDIGRVKTSYYHSERDILSNRYHCPPRIVNDKYLIDSIRKK